MPVHRKTVISNIRLNIRGFRAPFYMELTLKNILIAAAGLFVSSLLSATSFNITGYLPSYRLESADRAMGSTVLDLSAFRPDYRSTRIVSQLNLENTYDTFPLSYDYHSIEDWYGNNVDHIIYFSVKPGEKGSLDLSDVKERDLARLKNINHSFGTDLTIAVSGSSSDFSPMAADKQYRDSFLRSLLVFCMSNGFTGIDFDWEFPKTEEDLDNYSLLITEAVELFTPGNRKVSAAVSRYRPLKQEIYDNLHTINLMAYDFYGRHSTYESAVEAAVHLQITYNIEPEKINLGIPFYGRIFSGLDPQYWTKSMIYRDIREKYEINQAQDEAGGYYYNGIETVKKKTNYARENNLGGVMIWELGQDSLDEFSLLKAIREEVR